MAWFSVARTCFIAGFVVAVTVPDWTSGASGVNVSESGNSGSSGKVVVSGAASMLAWLGDVADMSQMVFVVKVEIGKEKKIC